MGVPNWGTLNDDSFRGVTQGEFDLYSRSGRLHQLFDKTVERHPNRTAVVGTRSLTYAELQRASWKAANRLSRAGVRCRDIVGIVSENDWGSIATVLGVLRLGATCCLISPTESPVEVHDRLAPAERLLLVLSSGDRGRWDEYRRGHGGSCDVVHMEELFLGHGEVDAGLVSSREVADMDCPAFLFFTSGSTGRAQGVMMGHSFIVLDVVRQINDLGVCPEDRLDLLFSPSFSAFLAPTFLALCSGASCWIRVLSAGVPEDLAQWLVRSGITISTMSTTLMRGVMQKFPIGRNWPTLRVLSVGGEALHMSDVALFRERTFPGAMLQNAMASTETRTYAQYFIGHEGEVLSPLPIGYPVLGRNVELIDENGRLVSEGQTGRITIRSRRLAEGYWPVRGSKEACFETSDDGVRFVSSDVGYMDSRGCLYFAGRSDSVVKVRGQKVSLSRVEEELKSLPGVMGAVVQFIEFPDREPMIAAWVQTTVGQTASILRRGLEGRLPKVAMPSEIRLVHEYPRTRTGKVDRMALRLELQEWIQNRVREVESRDGGDSIIGMLSRFTQRVLEPSTTVESLGIDSLRSLELGIEVAKEFGKRLTYEDVLRCETVGDLVGVIEQASGAELQRVIQLPEAGCPHLVLVTSIAGDAEEFSGLVGVLQGGGLVPKGTGLSVIESGRLRLGPDEECTVGRFAELFLDSLGQLNSEWQGSSLVIVGYSWGGLLGYELARRLQSRGRLIAHLVLIDTVLRDVGAESGWGSWVSRWWRRALNFPFWIWSDAMGMSVREWRLELVKKMRRGVWKLENDMNAPRESLYGQQYRAAVEYRKVDEEICEYRGKLTVVRARTQSLTRPVFGALGWESRVEGTPRVEVVPGNHVTLIQEPRVRNVARVIGQIVHEVTPKVLQ